MSLSSLIFREEPFVKVRCFHCYNDLDIPRELYKEMKKEVEKKSFDLERARGYDGFYLSPCGRYYCDSMCYHLFSSRLAFTED